MENIASEELEPFAAMIMGRMYARCVEAKKNHPAEYESAWASFWYAMHGLEKIAIAARAPHFSIAMSNMVRRTANLIQSEIGIDPTTAPGWKWT